jgi:type VI secretion system secreted protein Hcp
MNRARRIALAAAASVIAAFAASPSAFAASDYFLKVDGINGESVAVGMTNAIDVSSFQVGAENTTVLGSQTTGAGAGKAAFNDLVITKNVDSTTSQFFNRLTTGQGITGMELSARKTGADGKPTTYMRYCFATVFVSKQQQTGDADGLQETLTLKFGAMVQNYWRQQQNGTFVPTPAAASWSIIKNQPFQDTLPASCRF